MASETIKFSKVNTLPGTFEGSTIYIVKDSDVSFAEMYISNSSGSAVRRLPTRTDIDTAINSAVAAASNVKVVADIAARNALAPSIVTIALVIDATGDASVTSGTATYVYDVNNSTWVKISEFESMDFIVQWANISGRPSSSTSAIDDAVTKKHSHANLTVLDGLSDASGDLKYNGNYVDPVLRATDW